MKYKLVIYGLLSVYFLSNPVIGLCADTASINNKCKLQKELDENKQSLETLKQLLANAQEDAKTVGYTTLGTQAAINDDKRRIHAINKQNSELEKQLNKYSSIKVDEKNCAAARTAVFKSQKENAPTECKVRCKKADMDYSFCYRSCMDEYEVGAKSEFFNH